MRSRIPLVNKREPCIVLVSLYSCKWFGRVTISFGIYECSYFSRFNGNGNCFVPFKAPTFAEQPFSWKISFRAKSTNLCTPSTLSCADDAMLASRENRAHATGPTMLLPLGDVWAYANHLGHLSSR